MPFRFTFGTVGSTTELRQTIDFLAKQGLGYKNYDRWVQKTESEIDLGVKTAIIALSEGRIVGDLIFQNHKNLPRTLELKNLRTDLKGRYFSRFMLKQAESERGNCELIMCDVREDNKEIISFMLSSGYAPLAKGINLYDRQSRDIVFIKTFNAKTREGIVYQAKNLVLSQSLS